MYGDREITSTRDKMLKNTPKKHTPSSRLLTIIAASFSIIVLCLLSACKPAAIDPATAPLESAKKLIQGGNYAEAYLRLTRALQDAPQDPSVHLNMGWLYLYTDEVKKAESELAKAQELDSSMADGYHLQGAIAVDQAQKLQASNPARARYLEQQALENFKQSLMRDDKNHQTYFDEASVLMSLNQNDAAVDALDKGFDYIPEKDLETQVNFQVATCSAHARMQRYEDAIADCNQALGFTHSPAAKQRIEDMIENMKLLNPKAGALPGSPHPDGILEQNAPTKADKAGGPINEDASD